jgi:tetratricopeptide (TPR) repeat protein
MMEKRSVTRKEIEDKLASVGDYVKMDYLQRCLKMQIDFDTRRYVLTRLAAIYESRKMYLEAARLIRIAADINTTYEGKASDFIRSADLFIRGGNFSEADISVSKALATANDRQKIAIKIKVKEAYKTQAREFMSKDKRKHALETYEKIVSMDLDPLEKKETQQQLLFLYDRLGMILESANLKKTMSAEVQPQEKDPEKKSSFMRSSRKFQSGNWY